MKENSFFEVVSAIAQYIEEADRQWVETKLNIPQDALSITDESIKKSRDFTVTGI